MEVENTDKVEEPKDRVYLFTDLNDIVQSSLASMNADKEVPINYNDPANWPYELAIDVPIFREGKFEHWRYDYLEFTVQTLDKIITNFNSKVVPHDLSFDMEHAWRDGALAWLPSQEGTLYRKEIMVKSSVGERMMNVLFAKCILNHEGVKKVLGKVVRYFSSEIHPDYTTSEVIQVPMGNGSIAETVLSHGTTLVGGGFTNRPFIPGMPAAFSARSFSTDELKNGLNFKENGTITLLVDKDLDLNFSSNNIGTFVKLDSKNIETKTKTFNNNNPIPENVPPKTTPVPDNKEGEKDMSKIAMSTLMTLVAGKLPEEALLTFSENSANIDPTEKDMFSQMFSSVQSAVDNKKLAAKLAQDAQIALSRAGELEAANLKLNADLLKANEQSWQNETKSFAQKLSAEGHHTALVNEVNRLFSNMPQDLRSMKFSVDNVEMTPQMMVESILNKLPKEARLTTEFSLRNEANAGNVENVTQIDPNAGAKDGSNPTPPKQANEANAFSQFAEKDRAKVQKYSARYKTIPGLDMVDMINSDGYIG